MMWMLILRIYYRKLISKYYSTGSPLPNLEFPIRLNSRKLKKKLLPQWHLGSMSTPKLVSNSVNTAAKMPSRREATYGEG